MNICVPGKERTGKEWEQDMATEMWSMELADINVITNNQVSWYSSAKSVGLNEIVVRFHSLIQEAFTKYFECPSNCVRWPVYKDKQKQSLFIFKVFSKERGVTKKS